MKSRGFCKLLIWVVGTLLFAVLIAYVFWLLLHGGTSPTLQQLTGYCFSGLLWPLRLALAGIVSLLVIIACFPDFFGGKLEGSRKAAGAGQFGTARWMTRTEVQETYPVVTLSKATQPGLVVGMPGGNRLHIDVSDHNLLQVSPPGGGKTTGFFLPTIRYNSRVNANTKGKGASMLIVDIKGTALAETSAKLEADGYRVLVLNFRDPMQSGCTNLMGQINRHWDAAGAAYFAAAAAARTEEEKQQQERIRITEEAAMEQAAKTLADDLCAAGKDKTKGIDNAFFESTGKGLIIALILVVSKYAAPDERHIISVFRLLVELNGMVQEKTKQGVEEKHDETAQKNRLQIFLKQLPQETRAQLFGGAAIGADYRTSMNIFLSSPTMPIWR